MYERLGGKGRVELKQGEWSIDARIDEGRVDEEGREGRN